MTALKSETKIDRLSEVLLGLMVMAIFFLVLTITVNTWGSEMTGLFLGTSIIFGFRILMIMLKDTIREIIKEEK